MNEQEQRIAIAEACGKTVIKCPFIPNKVDHRDENVYFTTEAHSHFRQAYRHAALAKLLPDYLNDLNAMHDAESFLTPKQLRDYEWMLERMAGESPYVRSTAAQRAESFLKCLNLWKESDE